MPNDPYVNPWVRFSEYLKDADRVAGDVLLSGIHHPATSEIDYEVYNSRIEVLVKKYEGEFETIDVDHCLSFKEHDAKMNAAHMIGIAVGLRLHSLGGAR